MKTCPKCKQALPDDALFCPMDGTSLASAENDPLLGTVIADRYVLLERVGQGNSGTIYRGEHVVLRQKIAVKLLHHKLSKDEGAVDRFRQEAATLAQIDSDHIVRVSDFGVAEDERVFFAMEFLDGETLATAAGREGKLKEERALAILEQIGEALSEAHRLGYVHRDIRPRNIFLCERKGTSDFVKLLDFGLAKLMQVPKGAKTALGTTLGDPRYMSPEQAHGDQLDQRSDIYSLAIIGYQMVTGSPPFVGAGTFDVLTKHLEAQPVPIAEKVSGISSRFANAIALALSKKATDRYPTVARFLDALAGRAPVELTPEEGATPPKAVDINPATTAPYGQPAAREPAQTLIGTGGDVQQVMEAIEEAEREKKGKNRGRNRGKGKDKGKGKEALVQALAPQGARPTKSLKIAAESSGLIEKQKMAELAASARAPVVIDSVTDARTPTLKELPPPNPVAPATVAPTVAPTAPAPAVAPAAAAEPAKSPPTDLLKKTPTHPAFDPDVQSYDSTSQSGNWFAEGLAAEKELAHTTKSGPLPAIYDALDDDEEQLKKSIPIGAIIGVVVAAVALFLFLFLFVFNKKNEPEKPKLAKVVTTNPATENPIPTPKVEPKVEPKMEPRVEPKVEPRVEPRVEPKVEPRPKVAPRPKVEPKAVVHHPRPKVEPKPRRPKEPAMGRDPLAAATSVKEGRTQLQRGAYTKAREEFNKALEADPRNPGAHAGLGEVAFELGKYPLAAKHLQTAVLLSPSNAKFRYSLGNAYFKMNQTKKAVDQYRAALKINPNYAAARAGLEAAVRRMAGGG